MKTRFLMLLIGAAVVLSSLAGCKKKSENMSPDAGVAMIVVDAGAPVADTSALDAGATAALDTPDAAPPTQETYEKAATAAISNVQAASNELDKLDKEVGQ